ncbi:MAG: hypothetical protein HY514_00580 [Candidatus Aenigmarchaeota archaeon]|nr:hypothetical protein [Candidatus Aenigmarchaeota archaeon]
MIKKYLTTVMEVHEEAPDVKTFRLKFQEEHNFSFKAGQYIMVHAIKDAEEESTPYSISTTPSEFQKTGWIEVCLKRVEGGFMSNYMHSLQAGAEIKISGPYGRFLFTEPPEHDIIFLATGTGVSPLRSMIRRAFEIGVKKEIWLFFGARTEKEIIWREEFEWLAKNHTNFHYIPTLSREQWQGETGYVQDVMKKTFSNYQGKEYYIAGVKAMVEEVVKLLQTLDVAQERIHTEKFV